MSDKNLSSYLTAAVEAARAAGRLQRERLWQEHTVDFKGAKDLVTEVDRECEDLIVGILRSDFPDHNVLAEENQYAKQDSPFTWIIDPLDGTTNYAHGFPWFAVSISLEISAVISIGVVFHPMMDEMFTAVRGGGAFINGSPMHVSGRSPLNQCLLATGFPYDLARDSENNFNNFMKFQLTARAVRRPGAAALDLAYVAAGRLDGFWECKLKPWDVAAGQLLVLESGGCVSNHRGEEYSVYDHRILASNGLIHDEMAALLK